MIVVSASLNPGVSVLVGPTRELINELAKRIRLFGKVVLSTIEYTDEQVHESKGIITETVIKQEPLDTVKLEFLLEPTYTGVCARMEHELPDFLVLFHVLEKGRYIRQLHQKGACQ